MGMFDFLKGNKKQAEGLIKPPSVVLRENGIDPSDLKFQFGADGATTITGTAINEAERARIVEIVSSIDSISSVNDQITLAAVGAPEPVAEEVITEASLAPESAAADDAEAKTHTVVAGDTLWKIAQDAYGNGAEYMKIFEANKDILDNPDKIQVGQVLKLPS